MDLRPDRSDPAPPQVQTSTQAMAERSLAAPPAPWSLAEQRVAVLGWIASDEGARAARNRARHHQLPSHDADDVRQEAWLRANTTFARRTERYDAIDSADGAVRYAMRVIDNAAGDRARAARRRGTGQHLALVTDDEPRVGALAVESVVGAAPGFAELEASMDALALRDAVAVLCATEELRCTGCPDTVVKATALHVVNRLVAGASGPTDPRDELAAAPLVAEGLRRNDPHRTGSDAARRQRSSRCTRCVKELLARGWTLLVGAA